MTRNPNTSIEDLYPGKNSITHNQADARSIGSLAAAAFVIVVAFIARHFYR